MNHPASLASEWITDHYRQRAGLVGYAKAAAQMRKQGFPLWVAFVLLFNRMPTKGTSS